jgi:hypothetical protein
VGFFVVPARFPGCTDFISLNGGSIMIHVRFEGRSFDLDERSLEITSTLSLGDAELKRLLAGHLDVAISRFDYYVVDRRPNGNLVIRPEAVYG